MVFSAGLNMTGPTLEYSIYQKHAAKLSAFMASRQHAVCFILHIARARPCFNCFKELTHECLVNAYPFQPLRVRKLCHLG